MLNSGELYFLSLDEEKLNDIDNKLKLFYEFHYHHGYQPFLIKSISYIFSSLFIIFIFTVLICMNWTNYFACVNVPCEHIFFSSVPSPFIIICNVAFYLYWFILVLVPTLKKILQMRAIKCDVDLNLPFEEFIVKLGYDAKSAPFYIYRYDNFLLYLFKNDLIKIKEHKNLWYSSLLTKVLYKYLIKLYISGTDPVVIKSRFRLFSLLSFLSMPFLLIYQFMTFFFKEIQQFSSGNRKFIQGNNYKWTGYSKYIYREYNEYQHYFDEYIKLSLTPATNKLYLLYPNHVLREIIQCVNFPISIMLGSIVFFTLIDTSLLFNVAIFNFKLISWVTLLAPISYQCYYYLSQNDPVTKQDVELITKLFNNPNLLAVKQDISEYYQFKYRVFLSEVFGIICLWYVLGCVIYHEVDNIVANLKNAFVLTHEHGYVLKTLVQKTRRHEKHYDGYGPLPSEMLDALLDG